MGLSEKKGFCKDFTSVDVLGFQLQNASQRLSTNSPLSAGTDLSSAAFPILLCEEEMSVGLSHSLPCSPSRMLSPSLPSAVLAGAAELAMPPKACWENRGINPLGLKTFVCTGEYETKFHTSIWNFQTLTSVKAAPLLGLCLIHRFLRPKSTVNAIPWTERALKRRHCTKTRIFVSHLSQTSRSF